MGVERLGAGGITSDPLSRLVPVVGAAPCHPQALGLPVPLHAGAEAIRTSNPPCSILSLASHLGKRWFIFGPWLLSRMILSLLKINLEVFST